MRKSNPQDHIRLRAVWLRGDLVQKFKELCVLNEMDMKIELEQLVMGWLMDRKAEQDYRAAVENIVHSVPKRFIP